MELASDFRTAKRSGRRPLEAGKRRVQFGTRIAPETLQGLEDLAKSRNDNMGRIIDYLVDNIKSRSSDDRASK